MFPHCFSRPAERWKNVRHLHSSTFLYFLLKQNNTANFSHFVLKCTQLITDTRPVTTVKDRNIQT